MDECPCGDEDCGAVGFCLNEDVDMYELAERQVRQELAR